MSIDKKIIAYLKSNPGATPREIADALGVPLNYVRALLIRLRESGYVIKSSRGGYVVRVTKLYEDTEINEEERMSVGGLAPSVHEEISKLMNLVGKLQSEIDGLRNKINKLEGELMNLRKIVNNFMGNVRLDSNAVKDKKSQSKESDRFIEELKMRKILSFDEAKSLAMKSLEYYFTQGIAIPLANYVVYKEFYDGMKRKFPIRVTDVRKLSKEEKLVLEAMIREGMIYLHGGREYRLIE